MDKKVKGLFQVQETINKEDNNRHIVHKFQIDNKYKTLFVTFKYFPLFLEDEDKAKEIIFKALDKYRSGAELEQEKENWRKYLKLSNLLTLSFDDINGFRGCAHRKNNNEVIVISSDKSSPGMISGVVEKGEFKITMSIHALVTDICEYSIQVDGEVLYD